MEKEEGKIPRRRLIPVRIQVFGRLAYLPRFMPILDLRRESPGVCQDLRCRCLDHDRVVCGDVVCGDVVCGDVVCGDVM